VTNLIVYLLVDYPWTDLATHLLLWIVGYCFLDIWIFIAIILNTYFVFVYEDDYDGQHHVYFKM
jgi:hypothetical protein